MQHLLSFTVYDDRSTLGPDPGATLGSIGADESKQLTAPD